MSPVVDERKKADYADRLDGYVQVNDRIKLFYELYAGGRLVTTSVATEMGPDGTPRVIVEAAAYRTPDDPLPGRGWSWMSLPGTTPYTRGSELENTETSAWGRAIAALGILVDKSIASADEITGKQDDGHRPPPPRLAPRDATSDGGLIGVAEVGKTGTADFELRETPDGHVLSFRLVDGRKGIKVVAFDPIASALALVREDVLGKRVTVWGKVTDESFVKDGKTIAWQQLVLERIQTPDLTLPAPDGPSQLAPEDEAELDRIAF